MGTGVGEALLVAAAVGGEAGKIYGQVDAADARRRALNTQAKQIKLQTLEKQNANYDQLQKVLDAQQAMATVQGYTMDSPSFNAIQRNTVNVGSKYFQKIKTESNIALANIEIEKENVKRTLYAQLFGDVSEMAMSAMNMGKSLPTMK